jgi:hypothetical protein
MRNASKLNALFLPRLNVFDLQDETVLLLAQDSSTDPGLLDQMGRFFLNRPSVIEKILENPSTPEEILILIEGMSDYRPLVEARRKRESEKEALDESDAHSLFAKIQKMTVAEKVRFAIKGGREARALLIKDPNKLVSRNVLANPKITEQEIELIAQSKNVSEEVLRAIACNKSWVRNYAVMLSLVNNPRTPIGITMGFVKNLKTRDLGIISKNRNIPEGLRNTASKMLRLRQKS